MVKGKPATNFRSMEIRVHADFSNGIKGPEQAAEKHQAENFMAARANRIRPIADIEEGHISSARCQPANLALALNRPVSYGPDCPHRSRRRSRHGAARAQLPRRLRTPGPN